MRLNWTLTDYKAVLSLYFRQETASGKCEILILSAAGNGFSQRQAVTCIMVAIALLLALDVLASQARELMRG
jgi:hypothetical protein